MEGGSVGLMVGRETREWAQLDSTLSLTIIFMIPFENLWLVWRLSWRRVWTRGWPASTPRSGRCWPLIGLILASDWSIQINERPSQVREWREAWTQFSIAGKSSWHHHQYLWHYWYVWLSSELVSSYKNLTSEAEAEELWASLKSLSTEMSSYRWILTRTQNSGHVNSIDQSKLGIH